MSSVTAPTATAAATARRRPVTRSHQARAAGVSFTAVMTAVTPPARASCPRAAHRHARMLPSSIIELRLPTPIS